MAGSSLEKATSGVVCPQVWTNYPRGRLSEERINTERERARADAAEIRANALAKEILELKKQLESLKQK